MTDESCRKWKNWKVASIPSLPTQLEREMGKQREKQGLFHFSASISNTGLWGNINLSLTLEERDACYLFAMLHHVWRALNNWQVTVAAAGRGLLGQASLWAAQIPWWGCTLAAREPVRAAFFYHVEIKKNSSQALGSCRICFFQVSYMFILLW